ncbi:hypothetical protein N7539_004819 [Penicillium diatomitis]|uniref:Carrier domain-containing protein n=1 Tax=Penicillium diatomitis TaxID=2819901 RepID=A0A9X0BUH2_9EURO|nr:uncharacterized protein N7539_004819 [Penicillium diatomitis]KAJ5484831.1 hypothetical protein N7539_004819 [Penicillium diatomitis]
MMTVSNGEKQAPVAIVGMACRLPGQVSSLESFWELCSRGRSGWSEMPQSRFNAAAFYHPNPDRTGCFNPRGAHFLDEDIEFFDAPFFNITVQEARAMDPQQRLLLECAYEALENGGVTKQELQGRNVGVFVGGSTAEYEIRNLRDIATCPMYAATGSATSLQSNRISYYFDLKGPSMTVDTACSSSLTALHLACQSLRSKECSAALVGGCHLHVVPDTFVSMSLSRLFSESGKSFPFDQQAKSQTVNGYGRGEGAGCIILKPLQDAIDAGDAIRAVIWNTGVNQDGRTRGITMPNSLAQEELIRRVYEEAQIDPAETGYVEAHGTGTTVGDPAEARALSAALCNGKNRQSPLLIGSVKSNVGHAEGASGIIAVIKTALILERGFVLPNCGVTRPNDEIPMGEWQLKVPKKVAPWPRGKKYASVNNFGFGGTNAHVIMGRPPSSQSPNDTPMQHTSTQDPGKKRHSARYVYTISAPTKRALGAVTSNIRKYLEKHPDAFDAFVLGNLAYTLGQRRSLFPWRSAVSATNGKDLIALLCANPESFEVANEPSISLVLTGQGAQWYGMGRELLVTSPVFLASMQRIDHALAALHSEISIIDELEKDPSCSSLYEPFISQPACTALQIALIDLLKNWGVAVTSVIGHSSGEIAAAYAAGILNVDQCMGIAFARGAAAQLLKDDPNQQEGMMMVAGASPSVLQPYIDEISTGHTVIACVNSEKSVTISGDAGSITKLDSALAQDKIFTRKLRTGVAYHSPQMKQIAEKYRELMGKITPQNSSTPFYSTVRGEMVDASVLTEEYWIENLISPVLFYKGLRSLIQGANESNTGKHDHLLVEVGPHPALQSPCLSAIQERSGHVKFHYIPSLRRNDESFTCIQNLAAVLFTKGVPVNMGAVNDFASFGEKPQLLTNMINYPWDHSTRLWHDSRVTRNASHPQFPRHDILGSFCMENVDLEPRWRNIIRPDDLPWVRQHKVHGNSVYPMTGFLSMAVEGVAQLAQLQNIQLECVEMRNVKMQRMLVLSDTSPVEIMLSMKLQNGTSMSHGAWYEFWTYSWANGRGWDEHCHGFVIARGPEKSNSVVRPKLALDEHLSLFAKDCTQDVDLTATYANIASTVLEYGPLFRDFSRVALSGNGRSIAHAKIPNTSSVMPFNYETKCIVHPVTLDMFIQQFWFFCGFDKAGPNSQYLADAVQHMVIPVNDNVKAGTPFKLFTTRTEVPENRGNSCYSILGVVEETGEPWITVTGFTTVSIKDAPDGSDIAADRSMCFKEHFEPCLDFLQSNGASLMPRQSITSKCLVEPTRLLKQVSQYYISKALLQTPTQLSSFEPHQQLLYQWMQRVCPCPMEAIKKISAETLDFVCSMNVAGKLSCKVGEKLPAILKGQEDALSIMVEDDLLNQYRQSLDGYRRSYDNAVLCIEKMVHQNPNMNILEIGAGTGSATLPILERLRGKDGASVPRFNQYTYSDISTDLFEKAREKFHDWDSLMTYQLLDITSDPVDQGYAAGSLDLIIACNVLHATPQINKTIANVRKLLKPGGKLLLIEETVMHESLFTFACLPGWWASQDGRENNGPLLSHEEWKSVLKRNNFSGLDICLPDFPGASEASNHMMVATATVDHQANQQEIALFDIEKQHVIPQKALLEALAVLSDLGKDYFEALQSLITTAKGVLWVTGHSRSPVQCARQQMVLGLARTVRNETGLQFATLDLGCVDEMTSTEAVRHIQSVFKVVFDKSHQSVLTCGDLEFSVRAGELGVTRIMDDSDMNMSMLQEAGQAPPQLQPFEQVGRPFALKLTDAGGLDGFYFTDDDVRERPVREGFIEIQVCYSGLNFKDIMMVMGEVPGNDIGIECSGIITAIGPGVADLAVGDRVCAMFKGCYSNYIHCPASNAWKIPDGIALDVAATIPVTFCTAYYSMVDVARVEPGENVLIHSAAGGVGQAAILLAQSIGANVFATVSTQEKKEFLIKTYGLQEDQIFYSRSTGFGEAIRNVTQGRGVDVVLNSLSGDFLRVSFETLAPFGRFVELGKRDFLQNSRLEMAHFLNNVSVCSVDLVLVMERRPKLLRRLLGDVFREFGQDVFCQPPWPITSYSISDAEHAFRELRNGRQIGKIVVQMEPDALVHPPTKSGNLVRQDATYVVVGGNRGIGLDIVSWLAEKGAKHLLIVSRSGLAGDEVHDAIVQLINKGVTVKVCKCSVDNKHELANQLKAALSGIPPVRGVIYGAMILRDVAFEKMKYADYDAVVKTRVQGLCNVHEIISAMKYDLDFLISLSSVAGVVGNLTQSAYAASGTFMDGFAKAMSDLGVNYTAIDLAPVRDIGYLVGNEKTQDVVQGAFGDVWLNADDIHCLLASAIKGVMKNSCNNHCITGLSSLKDEKFTAGQIWTKDPRFSQLIRAVTFGAPSRAGDLPNALATESPAKALQKAQTLDQAQDIIAQALLNKLCSLLMLSVEDVDVSKSISAFGLDSLVAIEVRHWITREFDATLQLLEILASESVNSLAGVITGRSGAVPENLKMSNVTASS